MANYEEASRTNYVKIKDVEGLMKALEPFDIEFWESEGLFGFGGGSEGYWPSMSVDEEGNDIEFDVAEHICPFMEDGQVLIIMRSGHEELRYVSGWAQAWNSKGEVVRMALYDIYEMAAKAFNVPLGNITAAEY